jgi:hypothetical protein
MNRIRSWYHGDAAHARVRMRTRVRTRVLAVLLAGIFLAVPPLYADSTTEVPRPQQLELSVTAATTLEMQAALGWRVHPGERTAVVLTTSASPVSVNLGAGATWTPLPFLELSGGAGAGSGWNIPIAEGLRFNRRVGESDNELSGGAFAGVVWNVRSAAALQFDWAAIRPGDWNHILFRASSGMQYRAFTAADADESWLYEADDGENRNGWIVNSSVFFGYRMPLPLSLIGVLAESARTLHSTASGDAWGDDLAERKIAPLAVFTVSERFSFTVLAQWWTVRNFTGGTGDFGFYQDRRIDRDDPLRWEFYRAAVTARFRLR